MDATVFPAPTRALIALAVLAALPGCAAVATRPAAETPPPAPVAAGPLANDNLNAVAWQQTSVEYRLIAGQTWHAALEKLDKAIKTPDWDALPAGDRDQPARGLPPAVIVDVDETVLDNSPYQARLVVGDLAYSDAAWNDWVDERAAPAVPGALPALQQAGKRGVEVFYISNRTAAQSAATVANLQALGFPTADADHFLGKGTVVADCTSASASDKGCRRRLVGRTHRVLLQVGDQLGDFVEVGANTPAGRESAVRPYLGWVGERWFVLPNPTYGSWEPALFDNNWRQPEADRRAAKRATLRLGNPPPPSDQ